MQESGFTIQGEFYALPTAFRLGDTVLVKQLTELAFPEFAEALGDDATRQDPAVIIGLVGVAIWQANPKWPRSRVVKYVETIEFESLEFVGGEEAGPDVPPTTAEPGENSPSSATTSDDSPDPNVGQSNQTSVSRLGSDIGSPVSPLAA